MIRINLITAIILILYYTNDMILCQTADSDKLDHKKHSFYESYSPEKERNNGEFIKDKSRFDKELDEILSLVDVPKYEDVYAETNDKPTETTKKKKNRYHPFEQPTCSSKFKHETNVIVDSKASIKNGAELLSPIRYISKEKASEGMNSLHDSCMKKCCDHEKCDTALLSMKLGLDGYRCYLFSCNQNCFFIKHQDYVVLRMRTSEQLNRDEMPRTKQTIKHTITTKKTEINNFNAEMMGNAVSKNDEFETSVLAEENRIYFSNKSNAVTSAGNITLASVLLVMGISIVITLFGYMILSTKYINRQISRLRSNKRNVDVDGDYLINGMYL